jgi:hypothetical protein
MDKETLTYVVAAGLVLVVIVIPVWFMLRQEKRRTAALGTVAASLGATFQPQGSPEDMAALIGYSHIGSHGETRVLTNIIKLPANGDRTIQLFDYYYRIGMGKTATSFDQTVCRMESSATNLPEFLLHPESFVYTAAKVLGAQDLGFPDFPQFNRMFTVHGANESLIRQVLTPKVIQFCQERPTIILEGSGNRVLAYRSAARVKPEALAGFLDEGKQIASLIFDGRS